MRRRSFEIYEIILKLSFNLFITFVHLKPKGQRFCSLLLQFLAKLTLNLNVGVASLGIARLKFQTSKLHRDITLTILYESYISCFVFLEGVGGKRELIYFNLKVRVSN